MSIQADGIAHGSAVMGAGHDDRDLGGEVDPGLGDTRSPSQSVPRAGCLVRPIDTDLSLAVVTRGGRLEDNRQTERPNRLIELEPGPDRVATAHGGCRSEPGSSSRAAGSGQPKESASPGVPVGGGPATAAPGRRRSRIRR